MRLSLVCVFFDPAHSSTCDGVWENLAYSELYEILVSYISGFCPHWSGVVTPTTTQPFLPPLKLV